MNEHDPKDMKLIEAMGADAELTAQKWSLFNRSADYRFSYNFTWLGLPIIQYPDDIVALQEIVWRVRPDLIVETGIAHGGSLVFFASLLKLLGGERRAVGIDIDIRPHNRAAIEAHPVASHLAMIEGSSVEQATITRAFEYARNAANPLVVLDSNHTEEHVLAELCAYSPMVRAGSYVIVMDTAVEYVEKPYPGRPWGRGNNPLTAVHKFLAQNQRFEVDPEFDNKLLLSVAPSGFLRCKVDP